MNHPITRFLVVGMANSFGTLAIIVLLSFFLPGWMAFTIAFIIGVAFSVVVTGKWVFKAAFSIGTALAYAGTYLVIYFLGLLGVFALQSVGAPPPANAATIIITAPLSFFAGRLIFKNRRPLGADQGEQIRRQ